MLSKLPVTIELAILAMIVALLIGIPAGIISAVRKGTAVDYAANVVALSGLSIPEFLARHHADHAGLGAAGSLLPASGFVPPTEDPLAQHQDHDHAGLRARHRARRAA